jgi:large subunit ribosomal protein L19
MSKISRIEQACHAGPEVPRFEVGDTVDVHVRIREGEKERIQVFNGTVIRKRGAGMGATYTVRRIVQGQGVERVFPLYSPFVKQVVVKRSGRKRRSRLYYLRDRKGKATRLREVIRSRAAPAKASPPPAPVAAEEPADEAPAAEE